MPFDAEIENAGAFGDDFAEGGKDERRRDPDQRGEEADLEECAKEVKHGAPGGDDRR